MHLCQRSTRLSFTAFGFLAVTHAVDAVDAADMAGFHEGCGDPPPGEAGAFVDASSRSQNSKGCWEGLPRTPHAAAVDVYGWKGEADPSILAKLIS